MDVLLVLNAGSSSLKFALYGCGVDVESLELVYRGQVAGIGSNARFEVKDSDGNEQPLAGVAQNLELASHNQAIARVLDWIGGHSGLSLTGVGHRVVHGGERHEQAALVDDDLLKSLTALNRLAPHHQPHNLSAIKAVREMNLSLLQVACFDTAFHASQPEVARRLPLPESYHRKGIRRYGFHGLSYEYVTSIVDRHNDGVLPERLVIAHLGNGASLCAVKNGVGVATTMGFSTLDGLIMGTRSGSLDPGVLLHLMHEDNLGEAELSDLVYNQCGLLGLSGISSDMQTLLSSDRPEARRAVDSFCYSLQQHLGSLIAILQGLDGLVFTGGIGEHAAEIRARVCERLQWLGLELDESANVSHGPLISRPDSRVKAWVLPTNEELVIARLSYDLINR